MCLDTLNVMGVEPVDKGHSHELSKTMGSADGSTQTITCEWMQNVKWLPLCDRVAKRVGDSRERQSEHIF